MRTLREWIAAIFKHKDAEDARKRLEVDERRMDRTVKRIDKGAEELESRVYEVNHITEAVAAIWREKR